MRGGTSRGPYFRSEWLPSDIAKRDRVLLAAMGSPHELQIDGLGGANSLTSKVAIVSRSQQPGCDVDYLFAQVSVDRALVDTRPNCGNMLSGVGPFAIDQGIVTGQPGQTKVRIYNVNTRSTIDALVQTPDGHTEYEGDASIDGVPGTGAPIRLDFLDAWGAVTGKVFPTGSMRDIIDGVEVTCIDAAMPLMVVRAASLGKLGNETPAELDADAAFMERLESLRREAGRLMGLGDVSDSVIPKPVLVSAGAHAGMVVSRYFTPLKCHRSHAVTGAIGVATAFVTPGTVAYDLGAPRPAGMHRIEVAHPSGRIDVDVDLRGTANSLEVCGAGLIRTARKIMEGQLYLPAHLF
ncbi:4-oxalomesaconate tautomerase [Pigmentiphaga humi]|uniref:4-oxalomesaconate tautomerase n=2 Tax=Pigmentiphaga humi TaxID=2478468 RepID=A0A3P4B1M1_9BURK|nr:4-oxalomesaconate tautomerase [Pigmentiphaga humi]